MCVNSACSVNALRPDARVGFIFPLDQSFTNGVLGFRCLKLSLSMLCLYSLCTEGNKKHLKAFCQRQLGQFMQLLDGGNYETVSGTTR